MVERAQRGYSTGRATCLAVIGTLAVACYAFVGTALASSAPDPSSGDTAAKDQQVQKADTLAAKAKSVKKKAKTGAVAPVAAPAHDPGCGSKHSAPAGKKGKKAFRRSGDRSGAIKATRPSALEVATGPPWPGWGCEKKDLVLDSLWAEQPLSATWVVRNDGEGDLQIKIKGG